MKKIIKIFIVSIIIVSTLAASDKSVLVKARKSTGFIIVNAVNRNPFEVTVFYTATYIHLKNDKKLPLLFVLNPNTKTEVLRLKILQNNFKYKAHYHWTIGSKDAKHNNNYIYRLPYQRGTSQMISQGFNGKFSHFGKSQYAVDFNMKEGTSVYAAREGTVVKIKSDSNRGGPSRAFAKYTNYIIIEHQDKTLATYAHLKKDGVLVRIGQKIKRGELIGKSGKTGYAQGPHLHFIVYKALDGKTRKSIPIKFISAKGIINEPLKGKFYKAK